MLLVNTETIPGKKIVKVMGIVKGSTIQSKHIGSDIMSGLKTIVGGEITGYTKMLEDARKIAQDRMVEEAKGLGANAVVNVRFMTSSVMQGAAELLMYGTAVVVE